MIGKTEIPFIHRFLQRALSYPSPDYGWSLLARFTFLFTSLACNGDGNRMGKATPRDRAGFITCNAR